MLRSSIKRKSIFFAVLSLLFVVIQCEKGQNLQSNTKDKKKSDSIATAKKDAIRLDSINKVKVNYTAFIFPTKKKDSAMEVFDTKYTHEEREVILALNRLDAKNKWRADTLAIPDKIDKTLLSYSPFPAFVDQLKEVKKMVLFSYPIQAYALYDYGKLTKWGPTSMGKKSSQTERGLMFANWKKDLATSTIDSSWKLPFNVNIHNSLGIGWHQFDLPGFPASHSCLRLLMDDAKYLYQWVETWILNKGGATVRANGTPVIVFGDYNWGGKKPWKNLINDPNATTISIEQLNSIIEPHLEKILSEQTKREQVIAEINSEKN